MATSIENFAFILFGLPTWCLVDGTWAILSQLAQTLPESYGISAYLVLSLTIGNLLQLGIVTGCPGIIFSKLKPFIYGILAVGCTAGVLLAFLWKDYYLLGGTKVSCDLYLLFSVIGFCAALSNVTHFTFVASFPAQCTTSMTIGMSIGSMTAGIIAIVQSVVLVHKGYGVRGFYLTLAMLYVPAMLSYKYLVDLSNKNKGDSSESNLSSSSSSSRGIADSKQILLVAEDLEIETAAETEKELMTRTSFMKEYLGILFYQTLSACLGYGIVPSLISSACNRFRQRQSVLLYSTAVACVLAPIFRTATFWVRIETSHGFRAATAVLAVLAALVIVCVALPDSAAILHQPLGGLLIILVYVSFQCLFGFLTTCTFRFLKQNVPEHYVNDAFRINGIATQCGALCGTVIAFILIAAGAVQ